MRRKFDLGAAVWAGLVAGIVFMVLEMALVALIQEMSPWAPPRMIAAMAMGESVLPPMEGPVTFDATVFAVAMAIHFALSIVLAIILGWGISRFGLGLGASVVAGLLFGLAVYVIDFYGFTMVFPWFAMACGSIGIFAHAVFGLVAGGVYGRLEERLTERMAPEQPA